MDVNFDIVTISLPFTIDFDINRNPLAELCTGSVRIYNLNETTRNRLYKDQYKMYRDNTDNVIYRSCELLAGYGNELSNIFRGNITRCFSKREGTNYITTIEIYDGQYALANGDVSDTIPAGTTKREAISTMMGHLPNIKKKVIGNYDGTIQRAMSIVGNVGDLLNEITSGGFFIDSEVAYALGDGECVKGDINVINSNSGLLGSPQREETLLTFDMIFEPRVKIAQMLSLESDTEKIFNGVYKVIALQHRGMISDSICGNVTTTIKLWFGTQNLELVVS